MPPELADAEGFVFDVDGTLVQRGRDHRLHLIPGAVEVLEAIRASGRPFAVFTNGTHIQPRELAGELRAVGLPVDDDAALTPVDSFLWHAARRHDDARVLLLATEPARERIAAAGVRLAAAGEEEQADVVFVAHVSDVSLSQLEQAAQAVVGGAPAADRLLRVGLRGRRRADLQPRRDDHGGDRQGRRAPPDDRGQAVQGGRAPRWSTASASRRSGSPSSATTCAWTSGWATSAAGRPCSCAPASPAPRA